MGIIKNEEEKREDDRMGKCTCQMISDQKIFLIMQLVGGHLWQK
jgi:hypothetical protein